VTSGAAGRPSRSRPPGQSAFRLRNVSFRLRNVSFRLRNVSCTSQNSAAQHMKRNSASPQNCSPLAISCCPTCTGRLGHEPGSFLKYFEKTMTENHIYLYQLARPHQTAVAALTRLPVADDLQPKVQYIYCVCMAILYICVGTHLSFTIFRMSGSMPSSL
jgi:hypothetical protein